MSVLIWILMVAGIAEAQLPLTFRTTQIHVDTGIVQVLTGYFNGDNNADIVLLSSQNIDVLLGNGDGTFQAPVRTPAAGYQAMVAGDFNNDGKTDIVAFQYVRGASGLQTSIDTFLGNGNGTFAAPLHSSVQIFPSPPFGYVDPIPQVADFNHDGNLDLMDLGQIVLGTGDGTFASATGLEWAPCVLPDLYFPTDSAVADFNGSGRPDMLLLYTAEPDANTFVGTAVVCINNPDGAFLNRGTAYEGQVFTYYGITTGDFNGDGYADVLALAELQATGSLPSAFSDSVIFGNGDGAFQPPVVGDNLYFVKPVIVDFNGDGKSDLVQIGGIGFSIFLSNGDGTFHDAADLSPAQTPVSIAVGDFNHDGLPDIVSSGASETSILINTTFGIDSVVNAASLAPDQPVAPGSLVAIFGAGIGPPVATALVSSQWPDSMGGVSVTFNGIAAPLSFASATQINAQVPWEVSGNATVVVTANDFSTLAVLVATAPIAPGVFATPSGQALAFNSDGSIAGARGTIVGLPSHPAVAGDTLTVFANGLGPVTPSIQDGIASPSRTGSTPVFIGNIECDVPFAGLSATLVGVNQLRVIVPAGVHGVVPLQINAGGIITTTKTTIEVQ